MSERMFTQAEVSAIVQRRLKTRSSLLNDEVIVEMLRSIIGRLDAIEQEMKKP